MKKTILITGATDGIGRATATRLAAEGHIVLLHGRTKSKLRKVAEALGQSDDASRRYIADLSKPGDVEALADAVLRDHPRVDALINNAGVFRTSNPVAANGMDVRFEVNTVAPYVLTRRLLPLFAAAARVVNVSSAAQSPVDEGALRGERRLSDMEAYSQSKLALTMWSCHLGRSLRDGPVIVAVNPGSMLGTKMVKHAFGVDGSDIQIGARILSRAALSEDFADATGKYFDNDAGRFALPHPDALDPEKCAALVETIQSLGQR